MHSCLAEASYNAKTQDLCYGTPSRIYNLHQNYAANFIKFSEHAASVRSLLYIKAFSTVHAISDCIAASSKHHTTLKPKIYVTGPLQKSTICMKTTPRKLYQIHHATKDLPSTGINKEVYTPSKQCTTL